MEIASQNQAWVWRAPHDQLSVADAVWLAEKMSAAASADRANAANGKEQNQTYKLEPVTDLAGPDRPPADEIAPKPAVEAAEDDTGDGLKALRPFGEKKSDAGGPVASAVGRTGALRSLVDGPGFRAGLRAFRTRPPTGSGLIDEAATVERFIEQGRGVLTPQMEQGSRRWLRLSFLVEASASNALWTQPIDELEAIARQQGVFRQVRRISLTDGNDAVLLPVGRNGAFGRTNRHLDTSTWWKHEIVVVISDFTTASWWNGAHAGSLRRIAASQPLVLLHTLPKRLWMRSWVGKADALASAPAPACDTEALRVTHSGAGGIDHFWGHAKWCAIPVIGLEAGSFRRWSRALMGRVGSKMPAIFLEPRLPLGADGSDPASDDMDDPDTRIMAYNMSSSPLARQLARYLAIAAPLTFPVMRWVQQALLPQSDASHLAEFVLGGLLEPVDRDSTSSADDVVYEFTDAVRETLQVGIPITHAFEVLRTVGAFLEANQRDTLDKRTGIATWPGQSLDDLAPRLRAFALVSRGFLSRIGLETPDPPGRHAGIARGAIAANEVAPNAVDLNHVDPHHVKASYVDPEVTDPATPARRQSVPAGPANEVHPKSTQSDEMHTLHARRLSRPIIDMQWSPHHEGLLAILHDAGVEVWDTTAGSQGILIGQETAASVVSPCKLYWLDMGTQRHDRGSDRYGYMVGNLLARSVSAKGIVERMATGMRAAGMTGLSLVEVRDVGGLLAKHVDPSETGILVVFDSGGHQNDEWMTASQIGALKSKFREICCTVHLTQINDAMQSMLDDENLELNLPIFTESEVPDEIFRKCADTLDSFVVKLCNKVLKTNQDCFADGGPTAICWLSSGHLAIAERRGTGPLINVIDVNDIASGMPASLKSLRTLSVGSRGYVQKMCEQSLRSPGRSSSASETGHMTAMGVAWVDHTGALRLDDLEPTGKADITAALVCSPDGSSVAVSHHASEITLMSKMARRSRIDINLPTFRMTGNGRSPIVSFSNQRIVSIGVERDLVRAVTSNGYLFNQPVGATSGSLETAPGPQVELAPLKLKGSVAAAGFSADNRVLCVARPRGVLELWDTVKRTRSDRLVLRQRSQRNANRRVAISPDGEFIASSNGNYLEVFGLSEGQEGASFSRLPIGPGGPHVLWVDDRPNNNLSEREQFSSEGIKFSLARSTKAALLLLRRHRFVAVISDMGRKEGEREGYVLLEAMRARDDSTPVFFYASSNALSHKELARVRGAQGSTNMYSELHAMVMRVVADKARSGLAPGEVASVALQNLAREYDDIRVKQSSGDDRTSAMTAIVNRIIELAPHAHDFDLAEALEHKSGGARLVAYGLLFNAPSVPLLEPLVFSVINFEDKPFGQYWGLRAITRTMDLFLNSSASPPSQVMRRLLEFESRIPPGSDRHKEVRKILNFFPQRHT